MLNYASLSMPFKTLLVTALFLSLCTGVCTSILVSKKQGKLRLVFGNQPIEGTHRDILKAIGVSV